MNREEIAPLAAARRDNTDKRPCHRVLPALALGIAALLAFSTGVAQAAVPRLISEGNFGSGDLAGPVGVAVDQASGDVYVANLFSSNLDKFDGSGKLISPPSPFGAGGGKESGVAVNPVNGDVYVVDNFEEEEVHKTRIDTYASSGALLSSFPVAGCANFFFGAYTTVQIASDAAGNVWLPCAPENAVREYSPSGTLLQTITGGGAAALKGPKGVAVDAAGNVWVADTDDNRVEELSATGVFIREVKNEGVQALALDTEGNVFALVFNGTDSCGSLPTPCYHLLEYSSGGVQVADIGAGSIQQSFYQQAGALGTVAVSDSSGRVYVTDGGGSVTWVFGVPSAPVVAGELAAEVGTGEAKLGALVAPGGLETTYHFEYGTTSAYGQIAPVPDGDVGSGLQARTVWAAASGLAPGTTYHYRVVAANALGTVAGVDETFMTETAAEVGCPNEQFRTGFSAALPDCRAFELVTPANTDSGAPDVKEESHTLGFEENQASREGDRMSYFSLYSFAGSQTDGTSYLATRGASGWSSENEIPPQSGYYSFECPWRGTEMPAYSADLSAGVLVDGVDQTKGETPKFNGEGGCGEDSPELVSGEPHGAANMFLRDNTNRSYQLVDLTPPGVTPAAAQYDGGSADLSHVVFDEHAQLTANAPAGVDDLYEWSGGVVHLVTVLPDGASALGSLASLRPSHAHAVSVDGSHIFFTSGGNLYVRLDGSSTVQVDASQAGGSGGGGQFMDASADGSRVFFLDDSSAGLTGDTVTGSGSNLYEYDLDSGKLTDLTAAGKAEVEGVTGISEDGSYVYFVAGGVLASNENANKETAQTGQPNLYVHSGGETKFIATISPEDACVQEAACARVSPNGAFFAFASRQSVTGYDSTPANGTFPLPEVFLYSAASNRLACASCIPSGEPPTGIPLSAKEPTGGATMKTANSGGAPHYLTDSGRLFFDTTSALVPSDTNSQLDVYEYEGGQAHLISSGTSGEESVILDASESGDDVFFLTTQALVSQDTAGEVFKIYDARVGGGFPAPVSSSCSTADSCRVAPSPQPSIFGAPASATFSGVGNLAPVVVPEPGIKPKSKAKPAKCRKGFVKKKGRCVKKPKIKKHKARKSAHANRTGK